MEGEGDADDCEEVYARDAERAAEKFAEGYDSNGEYNILRAEGDGYIVIVRESDDSTGEEAQRFAIEAESVPTYRARLET